MEETRSKPTIEDVAKHCGVSIATVSRVINQSTPVSYDLELRVRKAIKELGFTPRQWKEYAITKTVAMVIPSIQNAYYGEIGNGAQEEADRQGVELLFLDVSENPERQLQRLNLLKRWRVDGLVVTGTLIPPEALIALHEELNLPIVVSRATAIPELPCILVDYQGGTSQAVKYLLSLNHQRIAYISGPPIWISSQLRLEAIQKTLSEVGLTLPDYLYQWCSPDIEEAFQRGKNLLELPEQHRPTAIIAFDDTIAIGVLHAIRVFGLNVPDDISVIGFNDLTLAAYIEPPLTTIAQNTYRIGQLAIKKLCDLMSGVVKFTGGVTLLECPLVVRKSTARCLE